MPKALIPFGNELASGHEELGGAMPSSINVTVDATGTVRRRPGIQLASAAPATAIDAGKVDGLYVTSTGQVYAVAESTLGNRSLYRIVSGGATFLGSLGGPGRTVFAETEAMLVMANGNAVFKYPFGGAFDFLGGITQTNVSHVIFNASRLLANDLMTDRSKVNYSGPASGSVITGHEQWYPGSSNGGFFSAEARPDPIQALGENANEVFVWGSTNLEIYATDPLRAFSRVGTRDYGLVAPYSPVRDDNAFVWLDHKRRVVRSDGRSVEPLSEAIQARLDDLSTVSDAFGYRVDEGPADNIVMTFPTAKLTLALQRGGGWAQWAQHSKGQVVEFPVTSHAHDPVTNTQYVGLSDGRVCRLVDGVADDLGTPITAYAESGYQDHGTDAWKNNKLLRLVLRRGTVTGSQPLVAWVQWQDRPGAWSTPRSVYLGDSGDTYPVVVLRSLGTYRRRNWRFIFSADADLSLVKAEETFTVTEDD